MGNQKFAESLENLRSQPKRWLVTGAAGFIGSNIVETLLALGQKVTGFDNLSTGFRDNLDQVKALRPKEFKNLTFVEGDVCDGAALESAMKGVDYVLHQAALGSVPRSIEAPVESAESNIVGFFQLLETARRNGSLRVVYASSSSVYGDHPTQPKKEGEEGNLLSPYALTKKTNELSAEVFHRTYGLESVGLRYFNVFGPRQDPDGAYAAVIPLWIKSMLKAEPIWINGDGETSRDFCHVENAVQANILAALSDSAKGKALVCNISCGQKITLKKLYELLAAEYQRHRPGSKVSELKFRDFRAGDIRHSLADISRARSVLGYEPEVQVEEGLARSFRWYLENL